MYKLLKSGNPKLYWNIIDLIKDEKKTDLIILRGFLKNTQKQFFDTKSKYQKLIGFCSFSSFPKFDDFFNENEYINVLKEYDYKIIGWCHCFKNPKLFIPDSIPYVFISESDLYQNYEKLLKLTELPKKYDIIANIPDGEWNNYVRNLKIAQKWLNYASNILNLNVIIVGKNRQKDFSSKITIINDFLGQDSFFEILNSSKCLFIASEFDASPRIIVEAISLNVPVLVNKNILGGWKYINTDTGLFFDPDENIENRFSKFFSATFNPKKYALNNFNYEINLNYFSNEIQKILNRNFENYFNGILYINLNYRNDRFIHIQNELKKMQIYNAFKIEAIYDKNNGHLGCAKSHIKALNFAKQNKWKTFIILEDDFKFLYYKERFLYMFEKFIECVNKWDVLLLGYCYEEINNEFIYEYDFIKKINKATTTIGYVVNNFTDELLENFNDAINKMEKIKTKEKVLETEFAIDQNWKTLQKKNNFFIFIPKIGTSINSKSSIMN